MNFRMANSQPTACANFFEPNQACGFVRVSYASEQKAATKLRPIEAGTLFSGDAASTGPAASHPKRSAISLLSRRSAGAAAAQAGEHVQFFIPGATLHTARVIGQRRWFLAGSTEWPDVIPADVELGDAETLAKKYPPMAMEIVFAGSAFSPPVVPARPSTSRATPSCRPCRRR